MADQEIDWFDVCYVGMSVSQGGIGQRLWEFRTRFLAGEQITPVRHAAAEKAVRLFSGKSLFFATMVLDVPWFSLKLEDKRKQGWVAYLEYEALAKFSEATRLPKPPLNQ